MKTLRTALTAFDLDERVRLHEVSWDHYEQLLAIRGENAVPKITYLGGEVELMTPSRYHEKIKKTLARLLEAWAEERGLILEGYGAWTLAEKAEKAGLEPDECYVLGPRDWETVESPDFALEVVWTSGGLSKLEAYRRLGVREVWFWKDERLTLHSLRGDRYETVSRSEILPDLDPEFILGFLDAPDQTTAVRELRHAMADEP